MDHATVISVEVSPSSLGNEPATTATLRDDAGNLSTVRILGGPNAHGGVTRLAGHVVPLLGMRVRMDLHEDPPPAWDRAWTAAGPKWPSASFPLNFYLAMPGSRDVGLDAGSELDVAMRVWSTVSCTGYRAVFAGTSMAPPADDGKNVLYFHDAMWPPELTAKGLAQTVLHTNANSEIIDADIHVNGQDYSWSLQGGGVPDVRSILTHEVGHSLGLNHSTFLGATMFATYGSGLAWRSLESDDRDGVCTLYPGMGAPGCDTTPCPGGFLCVANVCERKGTPSTVCSPCNPNDAKACAAAGDDARCVDIGKGALVCGRACATDKDCGTGFHCKPTTTSGDLQCVSDTNCLNGPTTCTTDNDCKVGTCRDGICIGASGPVDAGDDAKSDGGKTTKTPSAGCSCDSSLSDKSSWWPLASVTALLLVMLFSRRRALL